MRTPASIKRVAVMQPYFFPYAGYFRLFAAADEFVIFDCVQFPRRGRVHRTEVAGLDGKTEWLTLPLAYHPRDILIRDLRFSPDARAQFDRRLACHSWIRTAANANADLFRSYLYGPMESVVDFLETGLRLVTRLLGFEVPITRSSVLQLDPDLRGQDRVIAAASAVGATQYINSPGGRDLYDVATFRRRGIELAFLCPYEGQFLYLLPALMTLDCQVIRQDILAATHLLMA
jgi:hypothetical protein